MLTIMEDTVKIFIAGFKKWAKLQRINQTNLAAIISRHQSSVSAYFKNESRPTSETIKLWIDHYELDYEEILEMGRKELQLTPQPADLSRKEINGIKADVAEIKAKLPSMTMEATAETAPPPATQTDTEAKTKQPLELELDVDLLADVIEAVDIVFKKKKFKLPVDKKAKFIALQYALCIETEKEVTPDKIERYLKLVA